MSGMNEEMPQNPPAGSNLSMSDLDSLNDQNDNQQNEKRPIRTIYDFRSSQLEFAANVASTNRDIEAARDDLQALMTRAHAYCKNTGVASGSPLLASTPPRHRGSTVAFKNGSSRSKSKKQSEFSLSSTSCARSSAPSISTRRFI